jgi:hypothetical protein
VFVDTNNTFYVTERDLDRIQVWLQGSMTPTRNMSAGLVSPSAVFATINGDVYIDNGASNGRVDKWTLNATNSVTAMYVNSRCYGLFVDINDNLYCSNGDLHQVVKKASYDNASTSTIIAGTGSYGSAPNMLNNPRGIFVDIELNLYVADCTNNRIQLFRSGQLNGTTEAGSGAPGTITLNCPTGVILDADGYLFIADYDNQRVISSGLNDYRCIAGCTGMSGSAPNQLNHPHTLSFDSYGNLFVADTANNRIQKFFLATNSCGKCSIIAYASK